MARSEKSEATLRKQRKARQGKARGSSKVSDHPPPTAQPASQAPATMTLQICVTRPHNASSVTKHTSTLLFFSSQPSLQPAQTSPSQAHANNNDFLFGVQVSCQSRSMFCEFHNPFFTNPKSRSQSRCVHHKSFNPQSPYLSSSFLLAQK